MARVLKAKYFPNTDFFRVTIGSNSSYVWRRIFWGKSLLQLGTSWKVGCGEDIKVFQDPWFPRPALFKPITPPQQGMEGLRVSDLIIDTGWNKAALDDIFVEVDREVIWGIPLSAGRRVD